MNAGPAGDRNDILKQALSGIRSLRSQLESIEHQRTEPIAIVGVGCRFPGGADSPDAFWNLLRNGTDAIIETPPDRWDAAALFHPSPDRAGKIYTRYGGFLREDVTQFDNEFFRTSPREATTLDPQQRLLLEVAWEALERAGHARRNPDGGVFVGVSTNDYAQDAMFGDLEAIDVYAATGNALNAAAGRLAYFLGFRGPSIAVDTACSSSLVAVHLACQSLRARECRLALAGGVSLMLTPHGTIATCRARMLAPDGRCKTFDAAADGYVRSEGCALVALKRLSDAQADRDPILALILGSAVNQNGLSSALTVPNPEAQRELLQRAMNAARVGPGDYDYLEAHGTGTALGDPIEFDAIRSVLGAPRPDGRPCAIGSVKTNLGHLEASAGIAGLIKVALALDRQEIPPHLHLRELNPQISLDETPFVIPTKVTRWDRGERARVAGVSSFGFTGSNAHVVMQEAPPPEGTTTAEDRSMHLLTISGRDEGALRQTMERYAAHLQAHPEQEIGDVCFTANAGRTHWMRRVAVRGASREEIAGRLDGALSGRGRAGVSSCESRTGSRPKVAFVCSGQGAQFPGMGRPLYREHPLVRRILDQATEALRDELPSPLTDVMFNESAEGASLDDTRYTQPAVFTLGCALAELWRSWGVEPAILMGHSLGEYVAAYVAGIFSLEEGLKLVTRRAQLMAATAGAGEMVSIAAGEDAVREWIAAFQKDISIASVNAPNQTVISGLGSAVREALPKLESLGIPFQRLRVSHAFHSPLMDPLLDEFEMLVRQVNLAPPRIRVASNLTGRMGTAAELCDPLYWRRHVREPVLFQKCVETLCEQRCDVMIEIGPGTTLTSLGQNCAPGRGTWLPTIRRGRPDWDQILDSLGELYVRGCDVDWHGFDSAWPRRRVALPTYAFQRQPFRVPHRTAAAPAGTVPAVDSGHPFLGYRVATPLPHIQFEAKFSLETVPIAGDHRIHGVPWVNLVVYLETVLAAMQSLNGMSAVRIRDLRVPHPLVLPEVGSRVVQTILEPQSGNETRFQIFSLRSAEAGSTHRDLHDLFTLHCSGIAAQNDVQSDDSHGNFAPPDAENFDTHMPADDFYGRFSNRAVHLGRLCRRLETVHARDGEALGTILPLPAAQSAAGRTILDLGAIDACLQLMAALTPPEMPRNLLITAIEDVTWNSLPFEGRLLCHAVRESCDVTMGTLKSRLRLCSESGETILAIGSVHLEQFGEPAARADGRSSGGQIEPGAARVSLDISALLVLDTGVRESVFEEYVVGELARVLATSPDRIDRESPLIAQLDSLMAVEIKTALETTLQTPLPVAPFFDGSSIRQFSALLLQMLVDAQASGPHPDDAELETMIAQIENLSEEEAQGMLAKRSHSATGQANE